VPNKDQAIGVLIFLVCVAVVTGYATKVLFSQHIIPVLVPLLTLLPIGAWISWTIATTPQSKLLEEIKDENNKEEGNRTYGLRRAEETTIED